MNKLLVVSSLMALSAATQAYADAGERWPRWYVGLSGGLSYLQDSDISGTSTGSLEYNGGGMATLSLGYQPPFGGAPFNGLRLEAELGYHDNGLNNFSFATSHGSVQSISYMGNAYYDFRNSSGWTPYVGAGAGGASVQLSKSSGLGNTSGTDSVFAYQFMGGIGYAPQTMPMTEWTLGYRYFVEDSPEFNAVGGKVKLDDLTSHNVEVGAKFRF